MRLGENFHKLFWNNKYGMYLICILKFLGSMKKEREITVSEDNGRNIWIDQIAGEASFSEDEDENEDEDEDETK